LPNSDQTLRARIFSAATNISFIVLTFNPQSNFILQTKDLIMNNETEKILQTDASELPKVKRRHPYTMSNSTEETLRRMRFFPERAAKFLEKLNADRKKNSR